MSIRAYKLIEIKTAKNHTFGFGEDYEFISGLISGEEGGDIITFDRETIEIALKQEKDEVKRDLLERIIADFDEGEDYLDYYCY